ncbi:MAG: DNA pilot protein [Microviridae sp.]|nr:MAG: DNA pilot protein [Microviridae sp.]
MFDLIPAALSFIGGMEQRDAQQNMQSQAQDFNSQEAATNRAWEESMSNSAYQRAVADMKAADLNPMLAYSHGGASTPSGSAASSPAPPKLENLAQGAISSGLQAQQVAAEVDKTKAEARLANVNADNAAASPSDNLEDDKGNIRLPSYVVGKIASEANLSTEQAKLVEPSIRKILNEVQGIAVNTQKGIQEVRNLIQENLNLIAKRANLSAETRNITADAVLRELEIPRAKNLANVQGSPWMVKVSPYLRDLFTSGASAAALRSATR